MPIVDTEFLFALAPLDRKHERAMESLSIKNLRVPDTALFEFQIVLRARGRKAGEVAKAIEAVREILGKTAREIKTISTGLFLKQAEVEIKYGLSYFDSLIAASALITDAMIVSDDRDFDRVPGLKRILICKQVIS